MNLDTNHIIISKTWDYKHSDHKTLRDRADSLYMKFARLTNCIDMPYDHVQCIVASPEILSMLKWLPSFRSHDNALFHHGDVKYVGLISNRWLLYRNDDIPQNVLLLCSIDDATSNEAFIIRGQIIVKNFVKHAIETRNDVDYKELYRGFIKHAIRSTLPDYTRTSILETALDSMIDRENELPKSFKIFCDIIYTDRTHASSKSPPYDNE